MVFALSNLLLMVKIENYFKSVWYKLVLYVVFIEVLGFAFGFGFVEKNSVAAIYLIA
jgi:hypothetical protein